MKNKEMAPVAIVTLSSETCKPQQASTSSNRQRSIVKTSASQNGIPSGWESTLPNGEPAIQKSPPKSVEMQLLSGSVSFLPELHFQSYHGSTDNVDDEKEESYVLTAGKAKPGVLRRMYASMKQSKLAQLCR